MRPLCDRKEVTLDEQTSALAKFYIFTSTHVRSHFQGIILDDFAAEFDPFSPQFGEKFAPSYLPVGVKDWTGNAVNRVYSDQFGLYNGLNYSTWEVNPPNPTGYAPTMMVMCMNDAGLGAHARSAVPAGLQPVLLRAAVHAGPDRLLRHAGRAGAGLRVGKLQPSRTAPIRTRRRRSPASTGSDGVAGSVGQSGAPVSTITINALGNQIVDWYGYTGPSTTTAPYNQQKITRHYGFGSTPGTVTIGGIDGTGRDDGLERHAITVAGARGCRGLRRPAAGRLRRLARASAASSSSRRRRASSRSTRSP